MATTTQFFQQTIDLKSLTFEDWKAIARVSVENNPTKWAFYRWTENTSQDLSRLTLEDWEAIAQECDFKEFWAYFQYKNHQ